MINKGDVVNAVLNGGNIMGGQGSFVVGENVFVRTVTYHHIGKVSGFSECFGVHFLHLDTVVYIEAIDSITDAMYDGTVSKGFRLPDGIVRIAIGSIVDVFMWTHPIPGKTR